MPAGLQVFNTSSVYQIDENTKNFVLVKAGSVTCNTSLSTGGVTKYYTTITYTGATSPIICLACSNTGGACPYFISVSGTTYTYTIFSSTNGATVQYYIFDASPSTSPGSFGLEVYNAAGERVYHSAQYPLRIVGGLGTYTSGRTYAVFQTDNGYYNTTLDNGPYPDDPRTISQEDPPWSEEHWYYYYAYLKCSKVVSNVSSSVTMTFEHYETHGFDYHQYPFSTTTGTQFLTVDVTNYPTSL